LEFVRITNVVYKEEFNHKCMFLFHCQLPVHVLLATGFGCKIESPEKFV